MIDKFKNEIKNMKNSLHEKYNSLIEANDNQDKDIEKKYNVYIDYVNVVLTRCKELLQEYLQSFKDNSSTISLNITNELATDIDDICKCVTSQSVDGIQKKSETKFDEKDKVKSMIIIPKKSSVH